MALQVKDFSLTAKSGHGKITYTYTLRVTEESVDPVKNCSNVTVQAILQQTYSGTAFSGYRTGVSCTVDGETLFSDYCRRTIEGRQEHIFYTWEGQLPHDADGTRTIRISGKLWQPAAADYTPPTMNIPEGSMALTPIPRASRVGATDGCIGSTSAVVITPASEGFSHTLRYSFGEETGYLQPDGSSAQQPVRLQVTALSFRIPESFYAQIPDKPWENCTLVCDTYLEDTCIGSYETAFRVTAEESRCGPQAQWVLQDVNPDTLALTGDPEMLIRYMSRLQVVLDARSRCGAHITRRQVCGAELAEDVLEIQQVENPQVTACVTDSRGYSCRLEKTLPMIPYVQLTNNASVTRTAPTTGQALLLLAGSCYYGSFGLGENSLRVSYRLCPEGGDFSAWQEVECAIREDHTYQTAVELSGLDYTRSYRLQIRAEDALEQAQRELSVMPGIPVYHWKKDRFYFHVPVECDATVSGAYIRSHTLLGATRLVLETAPGQTVFLFGAEGKVCGVVGDSWWGSPDVTVQPEENRVILTFSQPVSGTFVLISDRQFNIE